MPIPETTMKTRNLSTCCLILLLAMPAWGQPPAAAANEAQRPLNLSLPRDVLAPSPSVIHNDAEENVRRNLQPGGEGAERRTTYQRYGAGYEARQRGMVAEGVAGMKSGMATPLGSGSAMAGGGRDGMGRGR